MHKRDYDRAIADYNEAIRLDPKLAMAYVNRGCAYIKQARLRPGHRRLRRGDPARPESRHGLCQPGDAYIDKGEYDRAIADYDEAIRLDPKLAKAYFNRGVPTKPRANTTGRSPTTMRRSSSIRNTSPPTTAGGTPTKPRANTTGRSPTTVRRSGSIRNSPSLHRPSDASTDNKGEHDRAIADYNEAIRLDPKYVFAYNGRGNAYQAKGEHDRAIADYSEAIRLDPKFVKAYYSRGNAYQAKGEHDRAIADYNEAIRLDPKYVLAYNGRGNAYEAKGEHDRAIADYSEAIRLDPKFVLAYNGRGTPTRPRANTTGRSPTTMRRSGSTRNTSSPTTAGGTPTKPRANTTGRSPTTVRRSGSTRNSPRLHGRGNAYQDQGRTRPGDRRLQ